MTRWRGRRLRQLGSIEAASPSGSSDWPRIASRTSDHLGYLPLRGGWGFTVSTTWVEGRALAVLTGVNRPLLAFLPIFIV